ncbi:MAG TPA: peptide ABC transporter substrate-binding protein [Anaerolineaceae bacterium]|nr:peptide ABC transporter substrate-binding protein [Anaerolineaceae bacterium]HPN51861.1 peptide ABC transporter substrate-binding protein [Anaerolineaceae bacterium]
MKPILKRLLIGLTLLSLLASSGCAALSAEEADARAVKMADAMLAEHLAGTRQPTPQPIVAGQEPASTPQESALKPTEKPLSTPTPAPTAGPRLDDVQTLRIGDDSPYSIDPAMSYGASNQAPSELFVGLTRLDEVSGAVQPGLAATWTVAADGLTWTFTLQEDISWVRFNTMSGKVEQIMENGQARMVRAADVEYGIRRVLDPNLDTGNGFVFEDIEGAADYQGPQSSLGVHAVDDRTLVIKLVRPASYLGELADSVWMAAQPAFAIELSGEFWTQPDFIATYGPFALKEWTPESSLTMVRNPFWKGTEAVPAPTLDEVHMTLAQPDVRQGLYLTQKLDVNWLGQEEYNTVSQDKTLSKQLTTSPGACLYYLGFNTSQPPFDNPDVRLAFSLALDRSKIIADVGRMGSYPAERIAQPWLTGEPLETTITFDLQKAQRLLKQAYANPQKIPVPVFTLPSTASDFARLMASSAAAQWQANLGVTVEIQEVNYTAYDIWSSSAPNLWRRGYCYDFFAPVSLYMNLWDARGDSGINSGWDKTRFDRYLTQIRAANDAYMRTKLYNQVENLVLTEAAVVIPLFWTSRSALTRPYVDRTYARLGSVERFEKWKMLAH